MRKRNLIMTLLVIHMAVLLNGCGEDISTGSKGTGDVYVLSQPFGIVEGAVYAFDPTTSIISTPMITSGTMPNSIRIHKGKGYIANSGSHDVQVFDPDTLSNLGSIVTGDGSGSGTGGNPWDITFYGNKGYVSNWRSKGDEVYTVSVIDLNTNSVTGEITVGTAPSGMLVFGNRLYVANSGVNSAYAFGPSTVSVIDVTTGTVESTINDVCLNASMMAIDEDGEIHLACTGDYGETPGKVSVIDPIDNTVKATITINSTISSIAVSPDNDVYVSGSWFAGTYKYSATDETNETTVSAVDALSGEGGGIIIAKDGTAYIADQMNDNLYILDTSNDSLVDTLSISYAYQVWIDE